MCFHILLIRIEEGDKKPDHTRGRQPRGQEPCCPQPVQPGRLVVGMFDVVAGGQMSLTAADSADTQ